MKLLIDTNVILDILLERKPFVEDAAMLFKIAQKKKFTLFITSTTVTDIYYIARKEKGRNSTLAFLKDLLQFVNVASVDKNIVLQSLESDMPDFEDAIQIFSAKNEAITTIITRNEADFEHSGLFVLSPNSFIKLES
ncbi:MAG: PIN domain-containing protein [Desulfamplus sp.]|nr:PIN domain-containing protein [Desulfamplus sp.]